VVLAIARVRGEGAGSARFGGEGERTGVSVLKTSGCVLRMEDVCAIVGIWAFATARDKWLSEEEEFCCDNAANAE